MTQKEQIQLLRARERLCSRLEGVIQHLTEATIDLNNFLKQHTALLSKRAVSCDNR